jgi:membrane associated rhomboid family serine protease
MGWNTHARRFNAFLSNRPTRLTTAVVVVLVFWFIIQLSTILVFEWPAEQFGYWFSSNPTEILSPGNLFAPLSHGGSSHLLANVGIIAIYGGASESHMSPKEWLAFFSVTSLVTLHLTSTVFGEASLGASDGAFAFLGFYHAHLLANSHHRNGLVFNKYDGKIIPSDRQTQLFYLGLGSVLMLIAATLWLSLQTGGILPSGRANSLGHLSGLLAGVGYGVARTKTRSDCRAFKQLTD